MVVSWSDAGGLSTQNSSRACLFPHTARFTRDGTTREDRLPNFLNGRDAQANELPPHYDGSVNTNTHTAVTDRLPSTKAVQELSASVEKSLWSLPSMKSTRDKTVTARSYLANDPRFELVKDPYPEPLGPGQYEVENGVPGIGPLPFGQPSRTTSPGRDPGRHSAAFVSPARPPLFSAADSPDRVYVGPDALPLSDKGVAWHLAKDQRAPVADYRYATRLNDARREVPADININSRQLSAASQPTQVGDQAHLHAASKVPFTSKEPRLLDLPTQRHNDVRLARPCSSRVEDHPGPGAYTPLTSLGQARRRTYRLYGAPEAVAIVGAPRSTSPWARSAGGSHRSVGVGSSAMLLHALGPATSSFTNTPRGKMHGPHTWATDSSLTRTM
ncbi:hypothetical protein V8C86DRAFT_2517568 [Haematococcus lacustris]